MSDRQTLIDTVYELETKLDALTISNNNLQKTHQEMYNDLLKTKELTLQLTELLRDAHVFSYLDIDEYDLITNTLNNIWEEWEREAE